MADMIRGCLVASRSIVICCLVRSLSMRYEILDNSRRVGQSPWLTNRSARNLFDTVPTDANWRLMANSRSFPFASVETHYKGGTDTVVITSHFNTLLI